MIAVMTVRLQDGSAGDANYEAIGVGYTGYRQPDPRIAQAIAGALGDVRSVLNVGAGAGSYEAAAYEITAVEPSASMRAQRPAHLVEAIDAVAEDLPFDDDFFDASMATFSVHQWGDLAAGLGEMRRVTRGPVLVLTCDPDLVRDFWLYRYAPLVLDTEARRYPSIARIAELLGGTATVTYVQIPLDCTDGFNEAYYGRPEMLLDPGARRANSAWSFVPEPVAAAYTEHLARDLGDGSWDAHYGALRTQPECQGSLVLIRGIRD